jgi:hypothetical protein
MGNSSVTGVEQNSASLSLTSLLVVISRLITSVSNAHSRFIFSLGNLSAALGSMTGILSSNASGLSISAYFTIILDRPVTFPLPTDIITIEAV